MVEASLLLVFEKMGGFFRISDVDFEEGSVIANIHTEFSSESTHVSTSSLARAVVDASDENGNLGELRSDTSFLQKQITPTAPPTTESPNNEDDERGDSNAFIGAVVAIGSAALVCVILAVCLVCYFKNKTAGKRQPVVVFELNSSQVGSHENHRFDPYYEE
ncbi:Hypothetical predicted protein [Paramuricea clavata]|nr:Hypothetical predicted protein [Paramuricea clavata]